LGGRRAPDRALNVQSPFDGSTLHTFHLSRAAVATSGIGRRSWLDGDGRPAHHLLDPSTGTPAFTGIVQATALAPSVVMAEIYAKAALLSGPQAAEGWLAHGGVIVFDDGSHRVIEPPGNAVHPPPRQRRRVQSASSHALGARTPGASTSVRVRIGPHTPASPIPMRAAPRVGTTT
jgi:hypothetical protein